MKEDDMKNAKFTLVAMAVVCFLTALLQAQQLDRQIVLSVPSDARPLSRAADVLQPKLGVPISYEDVALVYPGDYAHALDTPHGREFAARDSRFNAQNPLVMIGGSLDLQFPIDAVSRKTIAPISSVLQAVVDQHKARGNTSEFKVISIGDGFSIVPTAAHDRTGRLAATRSPLDFPISFPSAERSGKATLDAIVEAVTAASGTKVGIGLLPINLFRHTVVTLGANGETARDVLWKALQGIRYPYAGTIPKFSWRLLYAPATSKDIEPGIYLLHLAPEQREEMTPTGVTRTVDVPR
jgi:hypothetical protein